MANVSIFKEIFCYWYVWASTHVYMGGACSQVYVFSENENDML